MQHDEDKPFWHNDFLYSVSNSSFVGFSMVYQPIYDARDSQKKIISAEALMRYKLNNQQIPPDQFIPFCEEHGIIHSVGDYALRKSLEEFSSLSDFDLSININVSYQQFFNGWFAESVIAYLESTNIKPSRLTLEITERSHINDFDIVNDVISMLREKGIKIAIDDFGAGYANLSLLSRIDYDTIKIDRSCLYGMCNNYRALSIMKNIYKMTCDLGVNVVVEGIENKTQLDLLRDVGFTVFQGWHLAQEKIIHDLII